jgi:hypothetical protein
MPEHIVTAPDGRKFRVNAPEGATDDEIVRYAQQNAATPKQEQIEAGRASNKGVAGSIAAGAQAIGQGLTFGHYDELQALLESGLNSVTGGRAGKPYREALNRNRASDAAFQADFPTTSTALNVAGGMAVPIPGLGAAKAGMSAAERALRSAPIRGVVSGGIGGAMTGAGEADKPSEIPGNMITGALLGGGVGGALGGGAAVASPVAQRLMGALNIGDPEKRAERIVLRSLDRGGKEPASVAQALSNPPENAPLSLADVAGRPTVGLGATVANTPGAAMETAEAFTRTRRSGRPERIADLVENTMGGGSGTRVLDDTEALREMQKKSGQTFERAFNLRVPRTTAERLQPFVQDNIGQKALARGMDIIEQEHLADPITRGKPIDWKSLGVSVNDQGRAELDPRMQNLRLWHAVKMGYDDIVREAMNDPTKRMTQYERAVNQSRAALVEDLRKSFPTYARALDEWGDPQRMIDAMRLGKSSANLHPDIVSQKVSALRGAPEMEAARVGFGSAISGATSDPGTAVGAARRLAEDRNNIRRIEALQPDPAQSQRLREGLMREAEMGNVEQTLSPRAGSHTARLAAGQADLNQLPAGPLVSALSGDLKPMATWIGRHGAGISDDTANSIARMLMETDPSKNQDIVQRLIARMNTDKAAGEKSAERLRKAAQGLSVAGSLAFQD